MLPHVPGGGDGPWYGDGSKFSLSGKGMGLGENSTLSGGGRPSFEASGQGVEKLVVSPSSSMATTEACLWPRRRSRRSRARRMWRVLVGLFFLVCPPKTH